MSADFLDPNADIFRPPDTSTMVGCLHCGQEYDSYQMEWRIETRANGVQQGFWCCPTPGCDGRGFGFDIFATDPNFHDKRGVWVSDEDPNGDADEPPESGDGLDEVPW